LSRVIAPRIARSLSALWGNERSRAGSRIGSGVAIKNLVGLLLLLDS
jgi:hypothetical protein